MIAVLINNPSDLDLLESKFSNNSTFIARNYITNYKTGSKVISYFKILDNGHGENYNIVQLMDIPRQAILKIGDTIETGGKSTIFPGGIPIGTISEINKGNTVDNKIHIKLFNDMSNLGFVYVVKNLHKEEIRSLENNSNE